MGVSVISEADVREPNTYESVAVIRTSRDDLADLGIELTSPPQGSWQEAGPIEAAMLETETGEQPLLIWHLHFEEMPELGRSPLELRAPVSTEDPGAFVAATLKALALPDERTEWIVSDEHWPPRG
jgi:hypothetical protein